MAPSTQQEKRLVWHPRKDTNKFVVGGSSQITLYQWTPELQEIRHVTSQHDLQLMKCFAWSSDPIVDDLLAVGYSTGRVDLIRLEASRYARQGTPLSSGPVVTLPVRTSRSCTALAFSVAAPNYLAVGLDKVRGECSLVVWDINSTYPALSISSNALSTNEAMNTVDAEASLIRIPRADLGSRTDNRILQQHAPTEIVSSLSFLPQSSHLLLAGISQRWLRLFDLRSPVPSTTNVASKVQGIVTDPFDIYRIGCFGDGLITIWDARKLLHPLLTFTEKDAAADGARVHTSATYSAIEFSSHRRGTLASMEKDGSYVRFWDVIDAPNPKVEDSETSKSRDSSVSTQQPRRSWANLPWAATVSTAQANQPVTKASASLGALVLADTRRTKTFSPSLASFSLVPTLEPHSRTSNVMVVNKDGDLELYAVHDVPKQLTWSMRGDLAVGAGPSYYVLRSKREDDGDIPEPWEVLKPSADPSKADTQSHSRSAASREASSLRGRRHDREDRQTKSPSPALFGRGDEDGFPALPSATLSAPRTGNLSATQPGRPNPTHWRPSDHVSTPLRSQSRGPTDHVTGHGEDAHGRGRPRAGRAHTSSKASKQNLKSIIHVLQEDISMTMRRRVIQGYGISQPDHNAVVVNDTRHNSDEAMRHLTELWTWITHSRVYLCEPTAKLNGFDFSFEGLMGIWDGLQPTRLESEDDNIASQRELLDLPDVHGHYRRGSGREFSNGLGNFSSALMALSSRRGMSRTPWKPTVSTNKLLHRVVALQLVGWSLKEEQLMSDIRRWEQDGQYSRAACWLVFTKHISKAVEVLMRSHDELHHMMSGTLAAFGTVNASRSSDLREHSERLIVRIQDPYFRAMLTHLTLGDWTDVLEEEIIPFRERLAVAFNFLDDKALSSYLRRCKDRSTARGDIDALVITGLTKPGLDILQGYVDRTGDVQTAAILTSCVVPWKVVDSRAERWVDAYRELLDGWKLHHFRVAFDVERGEIMQGAIQSGDLSPVIWRVPSQILIRCHYCNKNLYPFQDKVVSEKPTWCPHCHRPLPRCSICLMTLGIIQDPLRDTSLLHSPYKDTMDDAIVICQSCRHGGHASHILEWFFGEDSAGSQLQAHDVCAVADCQCQCANEI